MRGAYPTNEFIFEVKELPWIVEARKNKKVPWLWPIYVTLS